MTANPIELVGGLITTANVPKADLVSWAKARVPQSMASASEVNSTNLAGQTAITILSAGAGLYYLDAADTTTADNGVTCIVSLDGKRFKPIAPRAIIIANASAFLVGAGGTNPAFLVDTSTASSATGVLVKSAAAGAGVALSAISSAANENLYIAGKGTGKVIFAAASLSGGIFIGSPTAPSGDDCGVLVGRAVTPASGLLNSHAFRDESVATQNVTASGFSGYSSFDSAVIIAGSATTPMNHVRSFQARANYSSTGQTNEIASFWSGPAITGTSAVIVPALYHFHATTAQISGSPTFINQYAFYSDPMLGATNNFFLFQNGAGSNPSVLGGGLFVGGLTTQISLEKMNVEYTSAIGQGIITYDTNAAAGTTGAIVFFRNTTIVGSITTSLTATAYNTSSDERLKEFIGPFDQAEAVRIIRADMPREFTWKATGERAIGWGAQTSYAVSPDLASPGDSDMTRKPGDAGFAPWGIDQGKRTPYLWAAMGGVLDRLDAIETRLAA